LTYNQFMKFIELGNYTKQLNELMDDASYKKLQSHLIENPKSGKFILGSKYLRKIRWQSKGKGKRGGSRHIYYFYDKEPVFFMLFTYGKDELEDLTKREARSLDSLVEQLIKEYRS